MASITVSQLLQRYLVCHTKMLNTEFTESTESTERKKKADIGLRISRTPSYGAVCEGKARAPAGVKWKRISHSLGTL
jgi:hypothetical protein